MNLFNLHVAIEFLLVRETKNVEGVFSVEKLLVVINGVDLGLSLGDVDVVVDVAGDEALGSKSSGADVVAVGLEQLVEDVVGPLHLLLLSDTGLLQQVRDLQISYGVQSFGIFRFLGSLTMSQPANFPEAVKWILMNFPKRDELSFLAVLAFP